MRRLIVLTLGVAAVALAGIVWATTYHTITVDGSLTDFAYDEKTAGDPAGDSGYGANNDLTTLYVTWDAQKLYLGFAYKAEQTGVLYLIDSGVSGGATNLCKSAGYNGAFPANLQAGAGVDFDLMIGFFALADHGVSPTPYLYKLVGNASTDITSTAGVQLKIAETVSVTGRDGTLEAAIPWDVIYGLGAGKVKANATLKIAGAIRGKQDNDGLGDVSPNPSGGVKSAACGSTGTVIDNLHQVTVDSNGGGTPTTQWSPGPNTPKTDGGPPPDTAPPTPDKAQPDKAQPDKTKPQTDKGPTADKPAGDRSVVFTEQGPIFPEGGLHDLRVADKKVIKADTGKKKTTDEGCACTVVRPDGGTLLASGLLLALLALARRRRG
jgi:hypothetical protein